jgi:hypothetical protein
VDALAAALDEGPLALGLRILAPHATATFDWKVPLETRGHLLLFEAFVTHQPETDGDSHIQVAKTAIEKFQEEMHDPHGFHSDIDEPSCLNLLGAALLRTDWTSDLGVLSQPCLVVRHKGTKGQESRRPVL